MKRIFVLFFLLVIIKCNSQSVHLLKDEKYIRHWETYENCCVFEIDTGVFRGVFLDSKQLRNNDNFFTDIVDAFFQTDSSSNVLYDFCPTKSEIDSGFKKICFTLKNDSVIKEYPCLQNPDFFCQYVGLLYNNKKMLIISFQRNDIKHKNKKTNQKRFELFKMIYSRIFFFKSIDSQIISCDSFWMLYDMDNDRIIKLLY